MSTGSGWSGRPGPYQTHPARFSRQRMIPKIDLSTIRFEDPRFLWLLLAPTGLLILWFWQAAARRGDAQRFAHRRTLPVRQRFRMFGGLLFWLCLILATASAVL